jgi:hypothetical protein
VRGEFSPIVFLLFHAAAFPTATGLIGQRGHTHLTHVHARVVEKRASGALNLNAVVLILALLLFLVAAPL